MVESAGEAMLLMVDRALWEMLIRQAKEEGRSPGDVLNSAVTAYMEREGADEAVGYLHSLAGTTGAPGGG